MKSPGCFRDTRHMKSSSPWIGPPSSSKITSLARMPALAAEVSFLTSATNTPRSGRPRAWPSASVKSDTTTPTRATAWARNDVCHDSATMVTNNNSTTCLVRFMRPDPLCIASPIHVTGIHQLIFVSATHRNRARSDSSIIHIPGEQCCTARPPDTSSGNRTSRYHLHFALRRGPDVRGVQGKPCEREATDQVAKNRRNLVPDKIVHD